MTSATDKPFDKINLGASGVNLVGVLGVGFLLSRDVDALENKLERVETRFETITSAQRIHESEGHSDLDAVDMRLRERLDALTKNVEELVRRLELLEFCLDQPKACRLGARR